MGFGLPEHLGPYRMLENGKKSCLLHSCLTTHCGCQDDISQRDFIRIEELVELDDEKLFCMGPFFPVKTPGKYLRIRTITRLSDSVSEEIKYRPVIEVG